MNDSQCVQFLQWALPHLQLRWEGFRKVRGQVCKRIHRRLMGLGLSGIGAYQEYLSVHPDEWKVLDSLCRITISRFYRDKSVFEALEKEVIPELANELLKGKETIMKCLSIGCASGEEAYSLVLLWKHLLVNWYPTLTIKVIGMDTDQNMLARGNAGCYPFGSLKDLPASWLKEDFKPSENLYCLNQDIKEQVEFLHQDVRENIPKDRFHLIFCRNIVFTYFEEGTQKKILEKLWNRLVPGGALVLGSQEKFPGGTKGFFQWAKPGIFRRTHIPTPRV